MRVNETLTGAGGQYRANNSPIKNPPQKEEKQNNLSPKIDEKPNEAGILNLSDKALEHLQELREKRTEASSLLQQELLSQLTNVQTEADEDPMKVLRKCLEIARRIISGDKVPPEDEKYLMDNDIELYTLAINLRMAKEKPKEWDSILEEENKEDEIKAENTEIDIQAENLAETDITVETNPE